MYHLIIADDEEKICEGITHLFPWKQIGFEVVGQFHSGQEIIQFLEDGTVPVDVIFCDIQMPGIDGLEVCRRAAELSDARIVLFSSHQNYEYFRKAIQYHVVDYLLKPIGYEDLITCFGNIRDALDRERAKDQEAELPEEETECSDRLVKEVIRYLQEHYREASLEKAAVHVGLSASYLSRIFKERSGENFSDLLLQIRMENACRMLEDVRCKSYEVAYNVGYDNPKNFTRAFKAYYGVTPSEYRREKMEDSSL
ncbi:MAG: response regulator [Candidatus Limivivens sp.]|nr:response regulator [Candidatus Limivivens sp.]